MSNQDYYGNLLCSHHLKVWCSKTSSYPFLMMYFSIIFIRKMFPLVLVFLCTFQKYYLNIFMSQQNFQNSFSLLLVCRNSSLIISILSSFHVICLILTFSPSFDFYFCYPISIVLQLTSKLFISSPNVHPNLYIPG